ncbi:MAG: CopG family transcriptional regulator [Gammaproteobacteria bacterium]|nr:CopG family transcriptional regulator [Gammaproteobacteria bacterium]
METTLTFDKGLSTRIQQLATSTKCSNESLMQTAILDYVERCEAKSQFIKESLESLEQFKTNGLHLTHAEVEDWLSSWGTDNEVPMPPCHN